MTRENDGEGSRDEGQLGGDEFGAIEDTCLYRNYCWPTV